MVSNLLDVNIPNSRGAKVGEREWGGDGGRVGRGRGGVGEGEGGGGRDDCCTYSNMYVQ